MESSLPFIAAICLHDPENRVATENMENLLEFLAF